MVITQDQKRTDNLEAVTFVLLLVSTLTLSWTVSRVKTLLYWPCDFLIIPARRDGLAVQYLREVLTNHTMTWPKIFKWSCVDETFWNQSIVVLARSNTGASDNTLTQKFWVYGPCSKSLIALDYTFSHQNFTFYSKY